MWKRSGGKSGEAARRAGGLGTSPDPTQHTCPRESRREAGGLVRVFGHSWEQLGQPGLGANTPQSWAQLCTHQLALQPRSE